MFLVRLALAALSVGNWGIYGPAMELLEAEPREPDSEEYLDSEKYQLRHRDLDAADSLAPFIARLNAIRREEPALARCRPPRLQPIDDECLLAWIRHDADSGNIVLVVVNLDPGRPRSGVLELDFVPLGLDPLLPLSALDLLDGGSVSWPAGKGVRLLCTPKRPLHVLRLSTASRTEPTA
jgi:starch synthase (maltosyl-transferring)